MAKQIDKLKDDQITKCADTFFALSLDGVGRVFKKVNEISIQKDYCDGCLSGECPKADVWIYRS